MCSPPARAPPWWLPSGAPTGPETCWGKAAGQASELWLPSSCLGKAGGLGRQEKEQRDPESLGYQHPSRCPKRGILTDSIQRGEEEQAAPCRANRNSVPKSRRSNALLFRLKCTLSPLPRSHLSEPCFWEVSMFSPRRFSVWRLLFFLLVLLLPFSSQDGEASELGSPAPASSFILRSHVSSRTADLSVSTNFLQHAPALPFPAWLSPCPAASPPQKEASLGRQEEVAPCFVTAQHKREDARPLLLPRGAPGVGAAGLGKERWVYGGDARGRVGSCLSLHPAVSQLCSASGDHTTSVLIRSCKTQLQMFYFPWQRAS